MKKVMKNICPAIFPMPVILIATYNEDGSVDVMNAAWGCAHDFKEIKLNISEEHRTTKNIRRTGCFSVFMADKKHAAEADYFGLVSGDKVKDKFERTGLTAHKSELIDAPIIEEFPICMECKAKDCTDEYGVMGDIIRLSIDEKYVDDKGKVDVAAMEIIAYDPFNHGYHVVGEKVAQAFSVGQKYNK